MEIKFSPDALGSETPARVLRSLAGFHVDLETRGGQIIVVELNDVTDELGVIFKNLDNNGEFDTLPISEIKSITIL